MRADGLWLTDEQGRRLILRGVNLGGSSKVPVTPNGATYQSEGFYDHRTVSFVGRPFPLEEADEHLRRLRAWGMTFLRFLVMWEAIEHAGPGEYDEAYLDYVYAVLKKAAQYGIEVFIDPHQDVWSRWTGGDGAPGWTMEMVGMDLRKLAVTGAAISHQTHGDPFPRMIWPTNYDKLGAGTMFTLFFGGNDFAPATKVDGVPVQEFLQSHYINAVKQLALRLNDLPNVVGYGSMNEPGSGYIGVEDVRQLNALHFTLGASPTPYQAMLLGAGYAQDVDVMGLGLGGTEVTGKQKLNPNGERLWRAGYDCVWKQNGVWTDEGGEPRLLRPDYFALKDGKRIDFANQYLKPFIKRFTAEIRAVSPEALLFVEAVPGRAELQWDAGDPPQVVNASHWYDILTLLTKQFNPDMTVDMTTREFVNGTENVAQAFANQLGGLKVKSQKEMGGMPTLVGEFGLPFDLDEKRAFQSGDFSTHTQALDLYYDAMDTNLLSCTIWNYTADNSNERGDLWNDEDLSIYSRDQQDSDDIHAGGRGLTALVRPYARKVAGEPLRMAFEMNTQTFELEYRPDPALTARTEIFVPDFQYPQGYQVELTGGSYDVQGDLLLVASAAGQTVQKVRITPA